MRAAIVVVTETYPPVVITNRGRRVIIIHNA